MDEQLSQNGRALGLVLVDMHADDDSNALACFVCPNCDGDITEGEHAQFGICTGCLHPH